jgi:hypothetical protein
MLEASNIPDESQFQDEMSYGRRKARRDVAGLGRVKGVAAAHHGIYHEPQGDNLQFKALSELGGLVILRITSSGGIGRISSKGAEWRGASPKGSLPAAGRL